MPIRKGRKRKKFSFPSSRLQTLFSRYNGGVPFRIRKFQKTDFDTLWRIDQVCFDRQMAYSRPELAFYMRRTGAFTLVAEKRSASATEGQDHSAPERQGDSARAGQSDSQPSSVLGFIVAEARRRTGHIITIDVVAEARRLGVGSALLAAAENNLREAGAETVALETAVNNEPAIRFYKEKGYFVEKTVRGYYSGQLDALEMVKELAISTKQS